MRIIENGEYTPEYLAERKRIEQLEAERGKTKPFEVGKEYQMVGGGTVTCVELSPNYECARFSDGEEQTIEGRTFTTGWRYNRDNIDRGRVTGTPFDHSDPRCVIPEPADECDDGLHSWIEEVGKLPADTACTRCGELYGDPD